MEIGRSILVPLCPPHIPHIRS